MGEIIFENDVATSLGSIEGEENLKTMPGLIQINPPPEDGKCECCGKHMSELKPFGKAGDPLVGDFDGALLVKKFRTELPPPDIRLEKIFQWMLLNCKPKGDNESIEDLLALEYGEEDANAMLMMISGGSQVGASWECRDCAVLDRFSYFAKLGFDLEAYYSWKPGQKRTTGDDDRKKVGPKKKLKRLTNSDEYMSWSEFKRKYLSKIEILADVFGLDKEDIINNYEENFKHRDTVFSGDADWKFVDGIMEIIYENESQEQRFSYLLKLNETAGAKEIFDEIYRIWIDQRYHEYDCLIPKMPRVGRSRSESGQGDIIDIYLVDRDFNGRTYIDTSYGEDYADCDYPLVVKVKRNSDMTLDGLICSLRDLADSLEAGFSNIEDMIYGGGFVSKDVETQRENSENHEQDKEINEEIKRG